jgi:hypothetical protein
MTTPRTTQAQLEVIVARINKLLKCPMTPYTNGCSNPNNYHLDYGYGGVSLRKMSGSLGGSSNIFGGFCGKKELQKLMLAFIGGLETAEEASEILQRKFCEVNGLTLAAPTPKEST